MRFRNGVSSKKLLDRLEKQESEVYGFSYHKIAVIFPIRLSQLVLSSFVTFVPEARSLEVWITRSEREIGMITQHLRSVCEPEGT